jgi:hypothetical protein
LRLGNTAGRVLADALAAAPIHGLAICVDPAEVVEQHVAVGLEGLVFAGKHLAQFFFDGG